MPIRLAFLKLSAGNYTGNWQGAGKLTETADDSFDGGPKGTPRNSAERRLYGQVNRQTAFKGTGRLPEPYFWPPPAFQNCHGRTARITRTAAGQYASSARNRLR